MEILAKFLSFAIKNEQDTFLLGCIEFKDVARQRKGYKNEQFLKNVSCKFEVSTSVNKFIICRQGLVDLFCVFFKLFKRLITLKKKGEAPIDKRGKHPAAKAVLEFIQQVIDHISTFLVDDSHYNTTGYLYLNQCLTVSHITHMHHLF